MIAIPLPPSCGNFAGKVKAPNKKLVIIPKADHAVVVSHDVLLNCLNENVRPQLVRSAAPKY